MFRTAPKHHLYLEERIFSYPVFPVESQVAFIAIVFIAKASRNSPFKVIFLRLLCLLRLFLCQPLVFLCDLCVSLVKSMGLGGTLPYPVDGQLFRLRLKDSTEMAGAGCKARLGPLGHLLFI
jgi:hypothetical protein